LPAFGPWQRSKPEGRETDRKGRAEDRKTRPLAHGSGVATDALSAFGAAVVNAAETSPPTTADLRVGTAFALGWHMSELYRRHFPPAKERQPPDLPGLGSLKREQRIAILIGQVEVGVNRLSDSIAQAGLEALDLAALEQLRATETNNDVVLATHERLLHDLTAADFGLVRRTESAGRSPTAAAHPATLIP
jgi:hypothetical protein